MSLQEELLEAETRHEAVLDDIVSLETNKSKLETYIEAIKTKIADSAVTYSIGDRFKCGERKRLLVNVGEIVSLVGLDDGGEQTNSIEVENHYQITQEEFDKLTATVKYTRYWDARKQCKC